MNRKDEHISLTKAFHKTHTNDFDAVQLIHHSFSPLSTADVSIHTTIGPWQLSTPFYINAMTGGSERAKKINRQLATVARETGLLMATGSASAALRDASIADSYKVVREENPDGLVWANVGAGTSLENAKQAVELLQADGLQIHLNTPQELVMPEGDRDFSNWLELIQTIVQVLSVPVIVKEVGFGMSRETIQLLTSIGVSIIDVSGQGGTSFTQIENARREKRELNYLDSWGQSTVISLLEANEVEAPFYLLASGGIRNAYDIFKALSLGADGVGIAGTLLYSIMQEGTQKTIDLVRSWQSELHTLYTLTGKHQTKDLKQNQLIISGEPHHWCEARTIDWRRYANR